MALSHYSTTYAAIALIGLMLPLQWVMSWFREIPRVTGAVAVAFVATLAGAVIWYGPVTHFNSGVGPLAQALETQGLDVLPARAHGEGLLAAYLQGNTPAANHAGAVRTTRPRLLRFAMSPTSFPSMMLASRNTRLQNPPLQTLPMRWPTINNSLNVIWAIIQQLVNVLSAVGALLMVLRRKAPVITWQVGLLALAAVLWLAIIKLSGTLAIFYGWERALLQAFVRPRDLPMLVHAVPRGMAGQAPGQHSRDRRRFSDRDLHRRQRSGQRSGGRGDAKRGNASHSG